MLIEEKILEKLIFKRYDEQIRYTQDSPVYPDVWLEYFKNATELDTHRADLILYPHRQSSAGELFQVLSTAFSTQLKSDADEIRLASTGEAVAARLTFRELITVALPMTNWWQKHLLAGKEPTLDLHWLKALIGAILAHSEKKEVIKTPKHEREIPGKLEDYYNRRGLNRFPINLIRKPTQPVLWSVNRNRPATLTIERSIGTTKGDAGRKVFDIDGADITWAVIDSGIDATHPAFRRKDPLTGKYFAQAMGGVKDVNSNQTRVVASYDFTKFRSIISGIHQHGSNFTRTHADKFKATSDRHDQKLGQLELDQHVNDILRDLKSGHVLDWTVIAPLLRIPHNNREYLPPKHPHGTHVAGILGAGYDGNEKNKGSKLVGMCPGINLFDIRVLDDAGNGNEFDILAGLQFVRWLNNQKDGQVIHGINLSFSMIHTVASYACGATPACDSCERLVAEGTVVVAAAGNLGQTVYQNLDGGFAQGFRMVNITDPGNAESVITVGSTHKDRPHSYGVSYFSSKGPTGDGRVKPDIVAPGEKIVSCSLDGGSVRMDGTSMAAPHVSGAAALLMAKHRELIGNPAKIKNVLCKTATDLGREKYFQGCGMVDVLRALQAV